MKNFILSCLFALLALVFAFYISLVESGLIWVFWNYMIVPIWPAPTISYLVCVGILTVPNFIIICYKMLRLYRKL